MSELRRDYVEDYVTLVPILHQATEASGCVYCGGSDGAPLAPLILRKEGGGAIRKLEESEDERADVWDVKVVPYAAPLVQENPQGASTTTLPFRRADAVSGVHYVLAPSPRHEAWLSKLKVEDLALALLALQEFGREMYQRKGVNYVSIYYEEPPPGHMHPLVHMLGLSEIPPAVNREYQAHRRVLKETGACPLCVIAEVERNGPRELISNDQFMSVYPWAPLRSYETWVIPRSHRTRFYRLTHANMVELAEILLPTLRAVADVAGSYYMVFYTSSLKRSAMNIHWSIRIFGGSELYQGMTLGYGVKVLEGRPEDNAKELAKRARKAMMDAIVGDRA